MCFSLSSTSHYVFCSSLFLSIHHLPFFVFLFCLADVRKGKPVGNFHLRRTKRSPFLTNDTHIRMAENRFMIMYSTFMTLLFIYTALASKCERWYASKRSFTSAHPKFRSTTAMNRR
jgi:hypothetical protein